MVPYGDIAMMLSKAAAAPERRWLFPTFLFIIISFASRSVIRLKLQKKSNPCTPIGFRPARNLVDRYAAAPAMPQGCPLGCRTL